MADNTTAHKDIPSYDPVKLNQDEATKNYPADGDSTASGGYGSSQNTWSDKAQRGALSDEAPQGVQKSGAPSTGLIDESTSGTDLTGEVQDAKQGVDVGTREKA